MTNFVGDSFVRVNYQEILVSVLPDIRSGADLAGGTEATQTTLIFVTHDETLARRCSREIRLSGGRLQASAA